MIGLEANVGREPQIDALGKLTAQVFFVAVERRQNIGDVLAAERHDVNRGELQIGAHPHFRNRHDLAFENGVAGRRTDKKLGHGMADQFGHAQHPLRWLAALLVVQSGHFKISRNA